MTFMDLIPILMVGTFALFLIVERIAPARALPCVPRWLTKGIAFFVVVGALNAILPALVMEGVGDFTVFHLRGLGLLGGALVMTLVADVLGYAIHRGLHTSARVWRWTHQMHHSAERMDMAGAAYFHPLDTLAQQVVPGVLLGVVLGITPMAAAVGGFLGYLLGVFPHMNVRTPPWLGYVIQRPEMHAVHHQRGVHAYNYGVLAFSDLIFGTWRNPTSFPEGEFGFWNGASAKIGAMLVGRDVTIR